MPLWRSSIWVGSLKIDRISLFWKRRTWDGLLDTSVYVLWITDNLSPDCSGHSVQRQFSLHLADDSRKWEDPSEPKKVNLAPVWIIIQIWINRGLEWRMWRNCSHEGLFEGIVCKSWWLIEKGSWGREPKSWSWHWGFKPGLLQENVRTWVVRRSWFVGMVMTWFWECFILSGGEMSGSWKRGTRT